MLLPTAERAIIDPSKLHGYVLSASHPVGRFNARFFAALGFTSDNWRDFDAALRAQHLTQPAVAEPVEALGQPFTIRAILKGPASSALVTSVWFLRAGEEAARFVSIPGRQGMTPRVLDVVVLERELSAHGLKRGDLGAVVEQYGPDAFAVEFVAGSGRTQALVTLASRDIRAVSDDDLISVRPSQAIAS